jgi:hypothetical protein
VVGKLVRNLEAQGRTLAEATIEDLRTVDDRFDDGDLGALEPRAGGIDDQLAALRELQA